MTAKDRRMTRRKIQRNKVYFVSGLVILTSIAMIVLFGLMNRVYLFGELGARICFETAALIAFGVASLVKGEALLTDEVPWVTEASSSVVPSVLSRDPVVLSYLGLRKMVGWVALGLPFALMIAWSFSGERFPASISGYYYSTARNLFVGSLCAIAVFQISCRGYDFKDEIAGILSGACAIGMAFFPTSPELPSPTAEQIAVSRLHLIFTSMLYLIFAYFCLVLFRMTAKDRRMTRRKIQRNKVYFVSGLVILASIAMIVMSGLMNRVYLFGELGARICFETTALIAFGVASLVKGEAFLKDEDTSLPRPAPGSELLHSA
jgi:hypothetical protein